MKNLFLAAIAGASAFASADTIDDVQAGQDVDFDLQGMTYNYTGAQSGSGTIADADAPPGCIVKAAGTLDFILDGSVLGFSGISIPMTGTKGSPTRVKWTANTDINQCISVDLNGTQTNILVRRVTGQLTANGATISPFFDSICGRGYNAGLDDTASDSDSFIDVEAYAFCIQNIFTRITLRFRTVEFIAFAGVSRGNVAPETFEYVQGDVLAGGLGEVIGSDDQYATALSDATSLTAEAEATTSAPQFSQSVIQFTAETSVERQGIALGVRAFRFDSNQWVLVGGSTSSPTDTSITVSLPSPTNFIDPITRQMKARVRWSPINDEDPSQDGWLHSVDFVRWSVEP